MLPMSLYTTNRCSPQDDQYTSVFEPGHHLSVCSFTCSGGEEGSSVQTGRRPRSGQTPQNEEATGLLGKVRGHLTSGIKFSYSCHSNGSDGRFDAGLMWTFAIQVNYAVFFPPILSFRVMFACSVCKFRSFYKEEMEMHLESRFHKDHFKFLSVQLSKPTTDFLEVSHFFFFFFF